MANPTAFGERLFSREHESLAYAVAQETADANGAPVAILERDGWLACCEEPPDDMDPAPLENGWTMVAIVEPQE